METHCNSEEKLGRYLNAAYCLDIPEAVEILSKCEEENALDTEALELIDLIACIMHDCLLLISDRKDIVAKEFQSALARYGLLHKIIQQY